MGVTPPGNPVLIPLNSGLHLDIGSRREATAMACLNPFEFRASFGHRTIPLRRAGAPRLNPFEFRASFGHLTDSKISLIVKS